MNVLELGESKHAHPKAIKPSAITCLWPHLQVSWVHLTNMSTEVFMGHAAALQEVRYLGQNKQKKKLVFGSYEELFTSSTENVLRKVSGVTRTVAQAERMNL